MGEQHRLGGLDVGRARAGRPSPRARRAPTSARSKSSRPASRLVDRPPRPEPQVRGDLVVPRPAGVELAGDRADPGRQRRLEVHVDVLERGIPVDRPASTVLGQGAQARDQLLDLVVAQEPGPAEPVHVGDRARDVVGGEPRSTSIERVKSATRSSFSSLKRPPHNRISTPSSVNARFAGRVRSMLAVGTATSGGRGSARGAARRRQPGPRTRPHAADTGAIGGGAARSGPRLGNANHPITAATRARTAPSPNTAANPTVA